MDSKAQPVELHCREKTGTAELVVGEKQGGKRDGYCRLSVSPWSQAALSWDISTVLQEQDDHPGHGSRVLMSSSPLLSQLSLAASKKPDTTNSSAYSPSSIF